MMKSENISINADGSVFLPEQLRNVIKNVKELKVSWNEEFIIINYSDLSNPNIKLSKEERIKHFFARIDQLIAFNEIDPLTEDDIENEIASYRATKNSQQS